jgi:DNA-binding SARP family transcriptional activator
MGGGATSIRLCGRLEVEWRGERIESAIRGNQGRLLFAYLVLHRANPVRRDALVGAVWPDAAPSGAEGHLAPLLSRLRKLLGADHVVGRGEVQLLLPEDADVDWERARADLVAARAASEWGDWPLARERALRAAAAAEPGLLPGLEAPWLDALRTELADLRAEALETAARAGLADGGERALAEAREAAQAAVAAAPFRESARAALMSVLRARGNVAEALQAFEDVRVLLRDELGARPGAELLALHAELLRDEERPAAPAAPARGRRPAPALPDRLAAAVATPLVGREAALGRLRDGLDAARAGNTGLVLLLGEGGIGKTRLVAELAREAEGVRVLYGRCDEEELFPFGPWIEMFGDHLAGLPHAELVAALGDGAPELVRLLPDLRSRLPAVPDPPSTDPETQRRRLFEAMVGVVRRLATRSPLLVVVDDLHWADRSSLLFGRHLVRSAPLGPVLMLGTYRDTDLYDGHPLVQVIADLERELEAELPRLKLEGLDETETSELVASWRHGPLEDHALSAIREETNGNPFFLKQLVRHLEEGGGRVPAGVRDVIGRRVARLPEASGRVLRVAALIGRDFDFGLLRAVAQVPEDELLDVLEAAVRAGLLVEVASTPGRYSFVHALLRTALEDELSGARRALLHARIGSAIEQRSRFRLDAVLVDLARHFLAAGPEEAERATGYAIRSAEQAIERLAYEEGADLLAEALAARDRVGWPDPSARAELLLQLAAAVWRTGRWEDARERFADAAAAAHEAGDAELFARAALGHGGGAWERFGTEDLASAALLEEALERLPLGDSALRARVLSRLGGVLYYSPQSEQRSPELVRMAIDMARRIGDDEALIAALSAAQYAFWRPGQGDVRLAYADELVELAQRQNDLEFAAEAYAWRVIVGLELCRRDEAERDMGRHAELAERLGQPELIVHAAAFAAMLALLDGRWDDAEQAAQAVLSRGARSEAPDALQFFGVEMIVLRGEQGRLGELEPHFARLVREVGALPGWKTALAWAYVQSGRPEAALTELEDLRANEFAALPFDANFDAALAIVSHIAAELGDAELAAEVDPLLRPYRDHWLVLGPAPATLGPIAYSVGLCALVAGDAATAAEDFALALDRAEAMRSGPYVARAHAGLAAALAQLDGEENRERAAEHHAAALAGAQRLGMVRLAEQLRAQAAA